MKMKILDRLSLAQINVPYGATLRVQSLNALEARDLAENAEIVPNSQYSLDKIAIELRKPKLEPNLGLGDRALVGEVLDYKTIRFFLVEIIADARGVTRDGEVIFSNSFTTTPIDNQTDEQTNDPFEE